MNAFFNYLRLVLLPVGWLYGLTTGVRNYLFNIGYLKQTSVEVPVFVVGNITVGGTGKTPITEYIIRLLYRKYSIGLLSRGYGRKTRGVVYADADTSAERVGDEPFQIKSKFPSIELCVAEKRVEGAQLLLSKRVDLIVCDDAFQHRYLKPTFSVVVIDYKRPLWNDHFLPAGELRESPKNLNRATAVIVNKVPDFFSEKDRNFWINKIDFKHKQNIFFASVKYGAPYNLFSPQMDFETSGSWVALSGIANPAMFHQYLHNKLTLVEKISFGDHYNFSLNELNEIAHRLHKKNGDIKIITTEKDASRLKQFPTFKLSSQIWVLPIEVDFLFDDQHRFNRLVEKYASTGRGDSTVS